MTIPVIIPKYFMEVPHHKIQIFDINIFTTFVMNMNRYSYFLIVERRENGCT